MFCVTISLISSSSSLFWSVLNFSHLGFSPFILCLAIQTGIRLKMYFFIESFFFFWWFLNMLVDIFICNYVRVCGSRIHLNLFIICLISSPSSLFWALVAFSHLGCFPCTPCYYKHRAWDGSTMPLKGFLFLFFIISLNVCGWLYLLMYIVLCFDVTCVFISCVLKRELLVAPPFPLTHPIFTLYSRVHSEEEGGLQGVALF